MHDEFSSFENHEDSFEIDRRQDHRWQFLTEVFLVQQEVLDLENKNNARLILLFNLPRNKVGCFSLFPTTG